MQGLNAAQGGIWRLICLRGLLALMALPTLNALRIVLTDWPTFIDVFPAAASNAGKLFAIALPLALLVAFIGL
jgi:hypothetical protein